MYVGRVIVVSKMKIFQGNYHMRIRFIAAAFFILLLHIAGAQEWGMGIPITLADPPNSEMGIYNPAYCDCESLLYFDTYLRPDFDGQIYTSHFDSTIYDYRVWSDPVLLPEPINIEGYSSAMASPNITNDTLFFASDRLGTRGGMDIWYSIKIDNQWQEPINLGDSINTIAGEFSPHYVSETGELFFDRREPSRSYAIYSSIYLGNGSWQTAVRLPEIINNSQNSNYAPFYREPASILYFDRSENIYRSARIDGQWQEPQMLGDYVNGNWCGPWVFGWSTQRPWLSFDGELLYYNKQYVEEDVWSVLYYSEKLTGIEDLSLEPKEFDIRLRIYPNPSNSSFNLATRSIPTPYKLTIYIMLGEVVKQYADCSTATITWNGHDNHDRPVASGVYLVKIVADDKTTTKKLILQK